MKKKVMQRAWEIARDGAKKFGGKVKEYFAVSLRMAWAEIKEAKTMSLEHYTFETKVPVMPDLKGTERQVAYANDIIKKIFEKISAGATEEIDRVNRWIDRVNSGNKVTTPEKIQVAKGKAETVLNGYCTMCGMYQLYVDAHPKAWTIIERLADTSKYIHNNATERFKYYAKMTAEEAYQQLEDKIAKELSEVYGENWKQSVNY